MKIRQKFILLAGVIGALMAIVSIIGYYTANKNLNASVEQELTATMNGEANGLNSWLREKKAAATYGATVLSGYNGDMAHIQDPKASALHVNDKDILEFTVGTPSYNHSFYAGDGSKPAPSRPWYQKAVSEGKSVFTDVYVDSNTKKPVISAAAPIRNGNEIIGAVCVDISLDALSEQIQGIKYHGEGTGYIIDDKGVVLGATGETPVMTSLWEGKDGWEMHRPDIESKDNGYYIVDFQGQKYVDTFVKVPETGWAICLSIPYDKVFGAVSGLRMAYIVLTLIGLALVVLACGMFSRRITVPVMALEDQASKLADGDLRLEDLPVTSSDEIGSLTRSFNEMGHKLRTVITHVASTSSTVAASSEALTANAQQSANASVHVAETVGEVSEGMTTQLDNVNGAKQNVDTVFIDINSMADKAKDVTDSSNKTAEAAQQGAKLMEDAIAKMGHIEKSVAASAEVVQKLGANSEEIGTIVDAISSIAEQTNLLSLNAAIEAARAGEHGRGFAVVADEVRKLAEESQKSAEEIRSRISSIQQDTAQAVESMQSGTQEVQAGTAAIRDVGVQFQNILDMVNNIHTQMGDINNSVQTVSNGANNIVEAVDAIDTISRKTADSTQTISAATEEQSASNEEIAAASQSLAKLAEDLQNTVSQFKY